MKAITVNISEPVYREFQAYSKRVDRKTSELIREAMELYRRTHMERGTSLRDRRPATAGGPVQPVEAQDDILGDMLDAARD